MVSPSPRSAVRAAGPLPTAPDFDEQRFRRALGAYATGVTVVTAVGPHGTGLGMTVSSFNAVSLDPPLVLFSIDRRARSFAALRDADAYAVNVLCDTQAWLSDRFARAGTDKWRGVGCREGRSGAPLLNGALGWFECVPHAAHDGGDHVVFVGRVVGLGGPAAGRPLIYFRSRYASLDEQPGREAPPLVGGEWPLPMHY